jgi:predicted PurR-regulated permease PerM
LVYILVIGAVFSCIYFIIPSIVENIAEFINNVPDYYETISEWYLEEVAPSDLINNDYTQQAIERGINSFNEGINDFLVSAVTGIATFTFSVVSGIITALIALVISFYVVSGRRKIAGELTITSTAYLGGERTDKIKDFLKSVDWVFGRYISAKLVQIILIFALCQISFLIIGAPYSTFLALIVALTNIVPFIGPIIGAVVAVLITLLESPILGLWVLIAILIIQTIDAYIFQPFFIGDKMGLSPFWVLVSVIVGGRFFGAVGILLSVPVAAVIKLLIKKYVIKSRKGKVPKKEEIIDEEIDNGEKT